MESGVTKNYYVFCEYRSNFPHEAVFFPVFVNCEMQSSFDELIALFSTKPAHYIIEEIYEKSQENPQSSHCIKKFIGYNINGKTDSSITTMKLLSKWKSFIYSEEFENVNEKDNEDQLGIFSVYFNGKEKFYSPLELYDKIMSTKNTSDNNNDIIVDKCVMISEKPSDYKPKPTLRFFLAKNFTMTIDDVKNKLLQDKRIVNVQVASGRDSIHSCGFGYVYPDSLRTLEDFLEKQKMSFDDMEVYFDLG
ncbi:putative orfan [Tupanvirus soda lake]|uniref:Orfan n=2 Tax=Tupanvirus TaxID=2094720 RepID=A0AC62AAS1_9VIRU|nr:putative orfan [Tupanvirus soda lake]QKU34773.1 putative orfan [Tupanvirus soda lake]